MVERIPIKHIDILVYPFFEQGYEFEFESEARKCRQWIKNMQYALKNKDTAFVVIHSTKPSFSFLRTKGTKALYRNFFEAFGKLKRAGQAYNCYNSGQDLHIALGIIRAFGPKGFDSNLAIRCYGQHAGACVDVGIRIGSQLKNKLHERGVNCEVAEHRGLSIKFKEYEALNMVRPEVKDSEFPLFLKAVRKKKASIFSLRNPKKVKEFLAKMPKH